MNFSVLFDDVVKDEYGTWSQICEYHAEAFEQKVESRLRSLDDEEQYKLLVELERWSESCISNEFFDLDRWW